ETGVVAILEARSGMYDVVVVEDEPLSAERAAHTLDALVAVHGVARSGKVNDALVPPIEQIHDRLFGGVHIVDVDHARLHTAYALQKYHRDVSALQLEEVRQVGIVVE